MKRPARLLGLLGVLLASAGCAKGGRASSPPASEHAKALDEADSLESRPPPPDEDVVENAARPFSGYRPNDGEEFTEEQLLTFIASADAICVGERHDNVLDHYAQLRILEGLAERRLLRGFELGLAMEMVRHKEQPTLDAYQAGRIDDADFEDLSGWEQEWGFPIQYYRPQMKLAIEERIHLIGLGVDRELTQEVARVGAADIDEPHALPEMDASDPRHRQLFDSLMEGHPMEEGDADKYYDAQLVWDEKMADLSAAWLSRRAPGRKLVIMAGSAHCHGAAIPARLARRADFTVVSVLPVEGGSKRAVSQQPQSAEEHITAGYDYQLVFSR